MPNERTRYQLLLERLASDPDLKERALTAAPEQFLALCREKGLQGLDLEKAARLQEQVKRAFDPVSGKLSLEQMEGAAGGVGVCFWNCYKSCHNC